LSRIALHTNSLGANGRQAETLPARHERRGLAWDDAEFISELGERHRLLAASAASHESIERLSIGRANCVVTGQQPAILGGPLYSAYKVAGCIGLARALTEQTGIPTVPIFWNGADDSDFDEARGGWLWSREEGPLRVELPGNSFERGLRIGSLPATAFAEAETRAVDFSLVGQGHEAARDMLSRIDAASDLGDRMSSLLLQLFGDAGLVYSWSGIEMRPRPWPESLHALRERLCRETGVAFNTVLANLYRNGADSVGWHADDEPELGDAPVIASVSLGAERDFRLRHRTRKDLAVKTIALPHGSLLLMRGGTQRMWKHQLPRRKRVTSARINLTFRLLG
jgi:hypothetical protein